MSDKIDKLIDDALSTEPLFQLRGDFRDKVVRLIRKQERKSQRKFYFYLILGIVFMAGAGIGILTFYFPGIFQGAGEATKLLPLAVMIGVLLVIVQFLDKKLVKDKMLTTNM